MSDVNMPKLSDTMEEGTVSTWKKQSGESVRRGDVLAEVESDKASFELEADADGVLEIIVDAGRAVPVGELIANIGKPGEAPRGAKPATPGPQAEQSAGAEPSEPAPAKGAAKQAGQRDGQGDDQGDGQQAGQGEGEATDAEGRPQQEQAPAPQGSSEPPSHEPSEQAAGSAETSPPPASAEAGAPRIKASPVAARLAAEMGVDLGSLTGSGPDGRIVKEDVLAAGRQPGARTGGQRPARERTGPEVEHEELSRMQTIVARRMVQSKTTVPHFYLTTQVRMDEAVRIQKQIRESVAGAEKLTVSDLVMRACALALRTHPGVNASWAEDHIEVKRRINIGFAVAQPKGLVVPVLRDVDQKDLVQISIESRQLIERARAGKPSPQDLEGGTFSISNLGMFGITEFAAVVNVPESAILAVGAITDEAVVDGGRVVAGKRMKLTLSVDHRVLYGADGAQFLAEVRRLLENPVSLVLPPDGG